MELKMVDTNQTADVEVASDDAKGVASASSKKAVHEDEDGDETETGSDADTESEGDAEDKVEFPKKAVNALNRQKRTNRKLTAQLRQLESRIREFEEQSRKASADVKAPDAKDYDNYADYLNGNVEHKIEKRMQELAQKGQADALEQQKQAVLAMREQEIVERMGEVSKIIPDMQQTLQKAAPYVENVSPEIERIFYELEEPALALYALQKEGRVQEVANMTPALAAAVLVQAEQRGAQYLAHMQSRRTTNAPDPMRGAKGTSKIKSEDSMSGSELLKKYKLK